VAENRTAGGPLATVDLIACSRGSDRLSSRTNGTAAATRSVCQWSRKSARFIFPRSRGSKALLWFVRGPPSICTLRLAPSELYRAKALGRNLSDELAEPLCRTHQQRLQRNLHKEGLVANPRYGRRLVPMIRQGATNT
jgi:hypothetical protein